MTKKIKNYINKPFTHLLKMWGVLIAVILGVFGFTNCGPVEYGAPPAEYTDNEKITLQSTNIENSNPLIKSSTYKKNDFLNNNDITEDTE